MPGVLLVLRVVLVCMAAAACSQRFRVLRADVVRALTSGSSGAACAFSFMYTCPGAT